MELLNRRKHMGVQSHRCRKALSKIIWTHEKAFAKFGKTVMKLFLNFIFKLDKSYYLTHDTLSAALSIRKKVFQQCFLSLTHDTLSTVFPFFETRNFLSSFFFSLMYDTLSAGFFVLSVMFFMFFWKVVKSLFCF